jgi:hypothetical protein
MKDRFPRQTGWCFGRSAAKSAQVPADAPVKALKRAEGS